MSSVKIKRLNSIILKEVTDIVQNSVKDPKIGFVTITDVNVTNDLSFAKVYVSFLGKKERNDAGLNALNRAKGHIRSELSKRLTTRKVPELIFILDDALENGNRIESILNEISKDK